MAAHAKVFARIFSFTSNPEMAEGAIQFTIEWKLLNGTRAGGKFIATVGDLTNDAKLKADLREALADYLSEKFSPEVFRDRDVVGYSV